jgi:hypothetical protein
MIQLLHEDGSLVIAKSDIVDELQKKYHDDNVLLLRRYDAGDCDTINWPNPDTDNLRAALYDAREMGLMPNDNNVMLPDGSVFAID